jgi:hypothetical protein
MDTFTPTAAGQASEPDTAPFAAFLSKKKINTQQFQTQQPQVFAALSIEYNGLGQAAFDQRKKFLINDWRLMFPINPETGD